MKLTISFKTPDAADYALKDALEYDERLEVLEDEEERRAVRDGLAEKWKDELSKWIEYGEVVTIEFDTEAGTATVQSAGG